METTKRMPLHQTHLECGGKMIEYAGWLIPERYDDIVREHNAVRTKAGLIDLSHMGKVTLRGAGAGEYLQRMITGDVRKLNDGQGLDSIMCFPDGGILDSIVIYRLAADHYLLLFHAANAYINYQWLIQNPTEGVTATDITDDKAIISLQGPLGLEILQTLTGENLADLEYFRMRSLNMMGDIKCNLARYGYTVEDGLEIFVKPEDARRLWQAILTAGEPLGVLPVGLGARHWLRLEAGLPLYGHELSPIVNPLEVGMGRMISFDKGDFIGKTPLIGAIAVGIQRKLTGIIMEDPGIPRTGYSVEFNGREIGWVTSGGYSPTLEKNIAMAIIEIDRAEPNEKVDVIIRNKKSAATVVSLPFI